MNTKRIIAAVPLAFITCLGLPLSAQAASGDWAGPYVGLHGGYAQDKSVTLDFAGKGSSESFDMTGGLGGVQAGFNWAVGNTVLGVEAVASGGDVSGDGPCPSAIGGSCKAKLDQLFTIKGRVGVPLNNFLLYADIGAASGQIKAETGSSNESSYQTGWLVGLGGALEFTNHWNGLVEIQHVSFGSNNYTLGGETTSVDNKFLTLNIGVNYKF